MDILTGALQEGSVPFFQTAFIGKSFIANSTWYDSLVTGSEKMKTTITGYYSIKSVENNIAVVLFSGVQKTIGVTEQMGQEFRMTSTNKVNAEIKVDLNTGIILSSSTIYDGIMYIDAGGMLIPVTIKTTSVSNIKIL